METHGNRSKIGKGGQDCMAIIHWRSQTRWGGNMSKNGKKGKIGKKLSKNLETHGNKSKISKGCQVCMTTIFEDLKQGGVVIWVRKVRKVRLEKNCPKNWRPIVIRVRYVRKVKSAWQQFLKISNKAGW